jgi:SAM-dependent methyltransferase
MADSTPWLIEEAGPEDKKYAPATLRNRDAILAVLKEHLPDKGHVLEIASGTGEHICYFSAHFPDLHFQPSDVSVDACCSIAAWVEDSGAKNILPPILLDIEKAELDGDIAAILCINMVHIAPWSATQALFALACRQLAKGGLLYLYGPFIRPEIETAPGNVAFDDNLRSRDPQWGLRNVDVVAAEAQRNDIVLVHIIEMPANNLSLVFRRT